MQKIISFFFSQHIMIETPKPEKTIKDTRKLFKLEKLKKDIKDIKNLFRLEKKINQLKIYCLEVSKISWRVKKKKIIMNPE